MHQENLPEGRQTGAVLDRAGQNIGFFVMSTGQRIQHSVPFLRSSPDYKKTSRSPGTPSEGVSPSSSEGKTEHPGQSVMGRAENVVDNLGGALGLVGSVVGLRMRRATARVREEVEDMWAEAQSLRAQREQHREATPGGQQHEATSGGQQHEATPGGQQHVATPGGQQYEATPSGQKQEEDQCIQQHDQTVT